jgi:signal transduction histidine kinase
MPLNTSDHQFFADRVFQDKAADLLSRGLDLYSTDLVKALELLNVAQAKAEIEHNSMVKAQALVAQGKAYRDLGEPQKALECLSHALELADYEDEKVIRADALNQRAGVNHNLGEYALALRDVSASLEIARIFQDDRRVVNALINMGILLTKLADYPKALNTFRDAHQLIRDNVKDITLEGQCLINLALLYEDMGDDQKALETSQTALQTVAVLENRVLEAIIRVNLGYAHKRLSQEHAALKSFETALTFAQDLKLSKVEIAALDGLGQIYSKLGQLEKAFGFHQLALEQSRGSGDVEGEIDALLNFAKDYVIAARYNEVLEKAAQALHLAKAHSRRKSIIEAHQILSQAHENLQNPREALFHFREANGLEKLLFNEEREKKNRQLAIQFDLERVQYQAEVYRIRTEIEREAKERAEAMVEQRTQELVASHQTIALQHQQLQEKVLELGNLLQQNEVLRQRLMLAARRNTTLNEEFLRRLSAELHDGPAQDLGYAVIKLTSGEIDAAVEALPQIKQAAYAKELETIQGSVSRALKEMRAIASGMCLPELKDHSLTEVAMRAISSHQRRTHTEVEFDFEGQFTDVALPVKITVYRLVQESLMNGFKHGGAGEQMVRIYPEKTHLHLEVSDKGPGFELNDALDYGGRLGLLGMRERVESLGGRFWIETALDQGTCIHAILPLII